MKTVDALVLETLGIWAKQQGQGCVKWEYPYGPQPDVCAKLPAPAGFNNVSPTLLRVKLHAALQSVGFTVPTISAEKETHYLELPRFIGDTSRGWYGGKKEVVALDKSPLLAATKEIVSEKPKNVPLLNGGKTEVVALDKSPLLAATKEIVSEEPKNVHLLIRTKTYYDDVGEYAGTEKELMEIAVQPSPSSPRKKVNEYPQEVGKVRVEEEVYQVECHVTYQPVIYPDRGYLVNRETRKAYAHVAIDDEGGTPAFVLYTTKPRGIDFAAMRRSYLNIAVKETVRKMGVKHTHLPVGQVSRRILSRRGSGSDDRISSVASQLLYIQKVGPFFEQFYSELERIYNDAKKEGKEKVTATFTVPIPGFDWQVACAFCNYLNKAQDNTLIKGFTFRYDMENQTITCAIMEAETADIAPRGDVAVKFYNRAFETVQTPLASKEKERQRLPVETEYALIDFYQQLTRLYTEEKAKEPQPETVTAVVSVNAKAFPFQTGKQVVRQLNEAQSKTKIGNINFTFDEELGAIICRFNKVPLAQLEPRGELRSKVELSLKDKGQEQCIMQ